MKKVVIFLLFLLLLFIPLVYAATPSQNTPAIVGHNYFTTNLISEWRLENLQDTNSRNNLTINAAGREYRLYNNNSVAGKHLGTIYDLTYSPCYYTSYTSDFAYKNFTICLWGKDYSNFVGVTIARQFAGGWGINNPGLFYWSNSSQNTSSGYDNSIGAGAHTVSVWNHFCYTFNNTGNVTAYLNGVQTSTKQTNGLGLNLTTYAVSIGGSQSYTGRCSGNFLSGKMDEILYFNETLNSSQINDIYNSYNGTVKLTQDQDFSANINELNDLDTYIGNITTIYDWRMDGGSLAVINMPFEANGQESTYTKGYSSQGYDGTVNGATWNATGGHDGFGAYMLNGTTNYINVTKNITAPGFSFSIWFYLNQNATTRGISIPIIVTNGWTLYQHPANDLLYLGTGGARYINWQPSPNSWHHLVCQINESGNTTTDWKGICYGDGILRAPNQAGRFDNATYIYLGGSGSSGVNGSIDDFRLYERLLTTEQMKFLYYNDSETISYLEAHPLEDWAVCTTLNDRTGDSLTKCVLMNSDNPPEPDPVP